MKTIKTIAAAVALTASLGVMANQFTDMDYDKNGVVTLTEFNNYDKLVQMEHATLNRAFIDKQEIARLQSIVDGKITFDNDSRLSIEATERAKFIRAFNALNKLVAKMERQSENMKHITVSMENSEILFDHLMGIINKTK